MSIFKINLGADEDALTVTKDFKKETVRETGGPNDNERGMARGREVRR